MSSVDLQAVVTGTQESRVEALRQILGYPLKQRDPGGSRFWFLRPGADEDEAEETCPIAVGFYAELDGLTDAEIKQFLTAEEQQREIYGHYTGRIIPNQPVMYLLLPESPLSQLERRAGGEGGRVAMILPTDGKLRQRQIQTFSWSDQDLQARLNRLRQDTLARTNRVKDTALSVIPLVEWVFYKPITTAKELAQKLAEVSRRIERVIPDVYRAEPNDGYLKGLLRSFQKELLPTLKLEPENEKDYSFADIYAQTIAYGLFTARVFSYTIDERRRRDEADPARKETDFNREDAWELLPETNPFLRRLFRDVSKAVGEYDREAATALRSEKSDESPVIADELIDAISEVVSILRAAKMDAILEDFRAKMNREDIVIRFYEDFLAAYKPKMRERRGVYYTPEPVVSYMVRSVDILLKEKFNKPLGLADPEVMILDPACGTGTFLLWIFQLIHQRFQENPDALTEGLEDRSWSGYVKDRLLPRVFGFELLMAPYAIAHLKLGLFLEETGYQFDSGKRLGVYLTNSLEDASRKAETLLEEFVSEEANLAAEIKQKCPISVVIGNPPYSALSANLGEKVRLIVDPYRYVDGERIVEKGALQFEKNLQEDYVKFFALSQSLIKKIDKGVVSLITNNSYIDSITLRGLRDNLLNTFREISILDLHGDADKREVAPDGTPDKNVFDIKQGVSIALMLRDSDHPRGEKGSTQQFDILGARENKYKWLQNNSVKTTSWKTFTTTSPTYFFSPLDDEIAKEYLTWISVKDIFNVNSTGFESGKDEVLTAFKMKEIREKINYFCSADPDTIKTHFAIKDGWGLTVFKNRNSITSDPDYEERFQKFLFAPFDIRYTFYRKDLLKTNSFSAGQHLIFGSNLSLVVMRQVALHGSFSHALAVSMMPNNRAFYSKKGKTSYFPLYLYSSTQNLAMERGEYLGTNYKAGFFNELVDSLKLKSLPKGTGDLRESCGPEDVFYYIYAILYCPTYRLRYVDFLKKDFPRIPKIKDIKLFRKLVSYGKELTEFHLMCSPKLELVKNFFSDSGGGSAVQSSYPTYSTGKVFINNKGDHFYNVSEDVWNFQVGGYQVCYKWLKDRKGRTLSQDDITHYQRIIVALQETIRLMQQIDEAIPGFPLE